MARGFIDCFLKRGLSIFFPTLPLNILQLTTPQCIPVWSCLIVIIPAAPPANLMDKFKPKAGSWECPGCFIRQPGDCIQCPACGTAKPGHEEEVRSTPIRLECTYHGGCFLSVFHPLNSFLNCPKYLDHKDLAAQNRCLKFRFAVTNRFHSD